MHFNKWQADKNCQGRETIHVEATLDVRQKFKVGDKVKTIASPNAFPSPIEETRGLVVTRISLHDSEGYSPDYYRIEADNYNAVERKSKSGKSTLVRKWHEGAAKFFEFDN